MLTHQFIIYVAGLEQYSDDWDNSISSDEFLYTEEKDAIEALSNMRDRYVREHGGSWTEMSPHSVWEHSFNTAYAYVRYQVVNAKKS